MQQNEEITSVTPVGLTSTPEEIADVISKEGDLDNLKDLTKLFNLQISKKNVFRVLKLNNLLDKIDDQLIKRITERPDEFNNADLIKYFDVVQSSIAKSTQSLDTVNESPAIVQQNTQVNINVVDDIDRESREKIINAVRQMLSNIDTSSTENTNFIQTIDEVNDGEI